MADIRLTAGNDIYTQPEANKNNWDNVFGESGDDLIRMYQGAAIGGPGNDRFEKIVDPDNPYRELHVAYWNAGDNLRVNLAEGWSDDGEGGRDTLIGVRGIHGSGSRNAWVLGDSQDNFYWPNGGDDTFIGGGGNDTVSLNSWFEPAPGLAWRNALLSELDIQVSTDGRTATVKPKFGTGFTINVTDVEYFDALIVGNNDWTRFSFADFIQPQTMAEQAIAAGGNMRWNASQPLGTAVDVTFSFVTSAPANGPGAPGFRAFTSSEQQLVRDILAKTAQITQIGFSEVAESGGSVGQMRFGVSQQAATKGVTWLPGQGGEAAGDVWMDVESMLDMAPGTEGYAALLHEIGHALGLRHPRNVDAGDAWAMQLRAQDDRTALSVMSQSPSGDGLFRSDWGPLDVLALRYLYGTKPADTGNTHYALGALQGGSQTTIVDDGGVDTLDASALNTGVSLDLTPGHLGSAGITPAGFSGVDNLGVSASTVIEHAVGSPFDDVLLGNDIDNTLSGGLGNDWSEGGAGTDTAAFEGRRADYEVSNQFGKVFVKARDGVSGFDTLIDIEHLHFSDQTVVLSPKVLGNDSRLGVDEDASLAATLPDPVDVARSAVSYQLAGTSAHGHAILSGAGQLQYAPAPNYHGLDTVAYDIVGSGGSNRYLVFITVLPINDAAPVSGAGGFLALGNDVLQGRLPAASDIDGDTITYSLATEPRNGDMALATDGSFVYTARGSFRGDDPFSFTVSDGMGGSNTYSARMAVASVSQTINGTEGADTLGGRAGSDGYRGLGGSDRITGGAGSDAFDGGAGVDIAEYSGARGAFRLSRTDYGWDVDDTTGTEGNDKLSNVERLKFADTGIALDLSGNAGTVAKILGAVFGPAEVYNEVYAGIGLYYIDGGMTYESLMQLAIDARLGAGAGHAAVVDLLYTNVVGVPPGETDRAYFVGLLDSGAYTVAGLGVMAADIDLNVNNINLVGLAGTGLEYVPYFEG
ncbi:MAG: cadherin-like domain-containing protein [Rubrivivax sp.]|nr:cadherin-like domain-containing protein [Rubrivivax sp.]MBP6462328.1 cadherin-like domain-containing protein [Rubrivivax sp.]MBP9907953.1 cadherin-like domain-containing protein [Rubrivivax sp.]